MVKQELVRRKLALLHGYLGELEPHRAVTLSDYLAAGGPRRAVERLIELVVEVAVDVNTHVVVETAGMPPANYRDSFRAAARIGLVDASLAEQLAPSAGLRNVLVHQYGNVDDSLVHAAIPLVLDGFREYASAVVRWLDEPRS